MASLTYMSIDQFIGKVVKDKNMEDVHVIIMSNTIVGSIQKKGVGNDTVIESKYKNIHFSENLYPEPKAFTFADRYNVRDAFKEAYIDQITRDDNFGDVCAIVDLVVEKEQDVIIVSTNMEMVVGFLEIFSMFVEEEFGLVSASYGDIEHGIKTEREIELVNQDVDTIKKNLNSFVTETLHLKDKEDMYNRFCDDLETKYKEILMRKTQEELNFIALDKGYTISGKLDKTEYVNQLFDRMFPRNSLGS